MSRSDSLFGVKLPLKWIEKFSFEKFLSSEAIDLHVDVYCFFVYQIFSNWFSQFVHNLF